MQLLGWLLLIAYAMVFWWSEKFLRALRDTLRGRREPRFWSELEIRIGAAVLVFLPFFVYRFGHVALMQQWVLVAALYIAVFRGGVRPANTRCVVAISLVATLVHPYFVPSVLLICAPYIVRLFRRSWRNGVAALAAQLVGVVVISSALGYLGGGANASNGGYGVYSADLAFLVTSQDTSRMLRSFAFAPATFEGMGFVGLGVLALVVAAAVALLSGVRFPRWLALRIAVVGAMTVGLALFAAFPVLHFGGHTIVDLRSTPFSLDFIGKVFRTNGRLVWSLSWLVALLAVGIVLSIPGRAKLAIVAERDDAADLRRATVPLPEAGDGELRLVGV